MHFGGKMENGNFRQIFHLFVFRVRIPLNFQLDLFEVFPVLLSWVHSTCDEWSNIPELNQALPWRSFWMLQLIFKDWTGYIIDLRGRSRMWNCRTGCTNTRSVIPHHFSIIHHLIPGTKEQRQIGIFAPDRNRFQFFLRSEVNHNFEIFCEFILTSGNPIQITKFEPQGWTIRKVF